MGIADPERRARFVDKIETFRRFSD
ncbi:MAG: hypothetical protein QOC87_1201, partial [Actinomycetota bacterium]|nr:hypothetical protein [Actinomycetota bacterium]